MLPDKLVIFFDGSCEDRNPGGWSTYGYRILDSDDALVHEQGGVASKPCKTSTNNFAEYAALGCALRWLADQGWQGELLIHGDSQLVCYQLTGEWNCNKPHLQRLRARCMELLAALGGAWEVEWVPREQNHQADRLSQSAYEQATGKKYPDRRRK